MLPMLLCNSSHSGSGFFVGLLGIAYYAQIHHIAYFIVVQIFVGVFEVRLCMLAVCYVKVFHFNPSVNRLARSGGSDGELVWEEEQRTVLGNMECSHFTWQHSWYSYSIDLGSAWKAMVTAHYACGGGGGGERPNFMIKHCYF